MKLHYAHLLFTVLQWKNNSKSSHPFPRNALDWRLKLELDFMERVRWRRSFQRLADRWRIGGGTQITDSERQKKLEWDNLYRISSGKFNGSWTVLGTGCVYRNALMMSGQVMSHPTSRKWGFDNVCIPRTQTMPILLCTEKKRHGKEVRERTSRNTWFNLYERMFADDKILPVLQKKQWDQNISWTQTVVEKVFSSL